MLDGIDLSRYPFSSVHEPCPADISADELKKRDWLISSTNEEHRQEGVKAIQRSIDLASQLGATAIIIHAAERGTMAKTVTLTVNGKRHTVQSAPDTPLLYVLRNELDLQAGTYRVRMSVSAVGAEKKPVPLGLLILETTGRRSGEPTRATMRTAKGTPRRATTSPSRGRRCSARTSHAVVSGTTSAATGAAPGSATSRWTACR